MTLFIEAGHLGALRAARCPIAPGVSAIVGPNGSGKSTLLGIPEMLRHAIDRGLPQAINHQFGGSATLRHLDATSEEATWVKVNLDEILSWRVQLSPADASVVSRAEEEIVYKGATILRREHNSSKATFLREELHCGDQLALRVVLEMLAARDSKSTEHDDLRGLGWILENYRTYRAYGYRMWDIPRLGSQHSADTYLHPNGQNLFTVLRNWSLKRDTRERYQFVLETLRAAFSDFWFEDLDFEQAGTTVTVSVHHRHQKIPIAQESTGFLMAMLHLTAIASAERGTTVAIDEIENSLHPEAIRTLVAAFDTRAERNDLSVLLATHSPVVLDELHKTPERVLVMERESATVPVQLNQLFHQDFLAQFSLGNLYTGRDFGAPKRPAT